MTGYLTVNRERYGLPFSLPPELFTQKIITGRYIQKLCKEHGINITTPVFIPRGRKTVPCLYGEFIYSSKSFELSSYQSFKEISQEISKGCWLSFILVSDIASPEIGSEGSFEVSFFTEARF